MPICLTQVKMAFMYTYLLVIILVSFVSKVQGLDFSLTKTPGTDTCGLLRCLINVDQGDSTIFSIVGMTVYDVTQAASKEKVASITVSVPSPELYVDPSRTDFLNASGSVSRYHADLSLSLRRSSDCETASFLCELDFMSLSGQLSTQQKTVTPQTDECPSDLTQTAADLASRTQQLENELSQLTSKYQDLETQLNNIIGGHMDVSSSASSIAAISWYKRQQYQGLDFSLTKTPGTDTCGLLRCLVNVDQGDSTIFSIVGMTVYDVTQATSKEKVASITVSVPSPELYVDPSRTDFLNASGSVSRYHADLSLSLRRSSDCETARFLCELDFMNLSGQLSTQQKTVTPQTDECPSDLTQTAADLASRTQQLENELSQLTSKYQDLETRLNNIIGGHMDVSSSASSIAAISWYKRQQYQGLDFSLTKTPGTDTCGLLRCLVNVDQGDSTIFSIVGMTVYDVTQATSKEKVASITVSFPSPELYVDPSRTDFLNASGSVSRYHADLSLSLRRSSDCETASFLCELDFMNLSGQLSTQQKTVTPQTDECPSDLTQTAADLASRTQQLENELSQLTSKYQDLEAQLNNIIGGHMDVSSSASSIAAISWYKRQQYQGLDFSLTKTAGTDTCGLLRCLVNVDQGDSTIFSIVGMTVYDVTQAASKEKVASITVSVPSPELYVDPSRTDFLNASGSVSRYHADLSLSLRRSSDCETASFLCELDFMNLSGQLSTQQKTVTPQTDECPSDLTQTAADLARRTQQLENELSQLTSKYQDLETRLNNIIGGHVHTSSSASTSSTTAATFSTTASTSSTTAATSSTTAATSSTTAATSATTPTTEGTPKVHTTASTQRPLNPGSRRGCVAGMSLDQPREKFTLPGSNKQALCDTETDGGAWIIIQRRTQGDVDFYKNWNDYKNGFGTPDTDFWLGNDLIHSLTSQGYTELRVDLHYQDKTSFAHYSTFSVGDEVSKYKLIVAGYSGTAGDSLSYHNGMSFTTYDQDNDGYNALNCAEEYHGAWWYKECYDSNLNGEWGDDSGNSLMWNAFIVGKSVTYSEMKVRHV